MGFVEMRERESGYKCCIFASFDRLDLLSVDKNSDRRHSVKSMKWMIDYHSIEKRVSKYVCRVYSAMERFLSQDG